MPAALTALCLSAEPASIQPVLQTHRSNTRWIVLPLSPEKGSNAGAFEPKSYISCLNEFQTLIVCPCPCWKGFRVEWAKHAISHCLVEQCIHGPDHSARIRPCLTCFGDAESFLYQISSANHPAKRYVASIVHLGWGSLLRKCGYM